MPYTQEQLAQLSPEELQAELQRVENDITQIQSQGKQGGFLPKAGRMFTGGLRGAMQGFQGEIPEAPTMPEPEKQTVYQYDEETGTMKEIGKADKDSKFITKKAPKEEKPRDIPKGEVAGVGGPSGLKTGAIVDGEQVPIKPFAESKGEKVKWEEVQESLVADLEAGPEWLQSQEDFIKDLTEDIKELGYDITEFPEYEEYIRQQSETPEEGFGAGLVRGAHKIAGKATRGIFG